MELLNSYEQLPINKLIQELKDKNPQITFDDLKTELESTVDAPSQHSDSESNQADALDDNVEEEHPVEKTVRKYDVSIKDDDDLAIVYYNNFETSLSCTDLTLENTTKSMILDKETLKPVVTQFNKILYNNHAYKFLQDKDWKQVVINPCYEGTTIIIFNHKGKWYVSTRRCLDSKDSKWIKNKSYYDMVHEAMEDKFTFDELNPSYCYHFVLVHHKNKNIVMYDDNSAEYKNLIHIMTTEKYSLEEVDVQINDKVPRSESETGLTLDQLTTKLDRLCEKDIKNRRISLEGYVCRYYTGVVGQSPFVTLKLQTGIYQTITKLKPNNSNLYQCYLDLYNKDKLVKYLPYFEKRERRSLVVTRINKSMKTLSKEILDLYHMTRSHKNEELYNSLPGSYKVVLYHLHGLYMKSGESNQNKISININSVYFHLKNLPLNELVNVYRDRMTLLNSENTNNSFINSNCKYTADLTALMFGD